ncbi:ABC-2 type transport system permease protein [Actinokineospora baliensis]|uniref:ABC transporter permease n=1 Tax=Actinokineospora baliensis TaxID=547056 RepID=UPI00195633EA|nr:ABC transporter permease [Actinokineospora baliensis]MBM7775715.1 ABC-2 type transport system permease protein [Actinokineospora baliensis]
MRATVTARRVLTQLRHDPRTIVMLLLVPTLLITLLRFVFNDEHAFSRTAPALLGVFPFVIMFLVASVTTLRERTTATLERLMTLPMGKLDLILGYAIAFGLIAAAQVGVATAVSVLWLGLDVVGSVWTLLLIAVLDALLGMALGLFVSAFATSEFQAIQFMPLFVLPQFLLCGLLQPRERMGWLLNWLSDVMPLSYAVDALSHVTRSAEFTGALAVDLAVVTGCVLAALALGAATLRHRSA